MSEKNTVVRRERLIYMAWLTASLIGVVALLVAGLYASTFFRQHDGSPRDLALRIEPQTIRLEEKVYEQGEMVRGKFRLINTCDQPLTIEALRTSCSCLASVAEGERKPPFVLPANSSIEILLSTTALSIQGFDQAYTMQVEASADGRHLPERIAALSFRVADSIKVDPPSLHIYEIPHDVPAELAIRLFTYRDSGAHPEPTIHVRGSKRIHTSLRKPTAPENQEGQTVTQYVMDVRVDPDGDSETVTGEIEVIPTNQPLISIPVTCSFKKECRLQPEAIEASGRPGAVIERDLFQEFSTDHWRQLELVSKPEGSEVRIQPFDARTNVIHVKLTMPPGQDESKRAESLVLSPHDRSRTIVVPVRYSLEE